MLECYHLCLLLYIYGFLERKGCEFVVLFFSLSFFLFTQCNAELLHFELLATNCLSETFLIKDFFAKDSTFLIVISFYLKAVKNKSEKYINVELRNKVWRT